MGILRRSLPHIYNFGDLDIRNDRQIAFGVIENRARPLSGFDLVADLRLNLLQSYKILMKDTQFPDNYFIEFDMFYNIFQEAVDSRLSSFKSFFMPLR